jgi:phosphoribosyl 1,2-cyclic phosphodiesterase
MGISSPLTAQFARRKSGHTDVLELTFLGTRGELDISSRLHRRHSALLVRCGKTRIMIDCGADWLHRFQEFRPKAIFLTHAHPDHAWGLAEGAPCPVYATPQTLALLSKFPLHDRKALSPRRPEKIGGIRIETFPVIHSIRAPAVGFRISTRKNCFFYVPDLVAIVQRSKALHGVQLYIGDGATVKRPLVRRRGRQLFGHTPITTQLGWCEKEGVRRAIFTHCGSAIVGGEGQKLRALIRRLGQEHGVEARLAHDGLRVMLRDGEIAKPA